MAKEPHAVEHTGDDAKGELAGVRVAILAETLYEDLELWYPYYRLREAGADVFVVGSGSADTYQSKHGYPVTVDAEADTVTASQFDAVIIPGGTAPTTCGAIQAWSSWCARRTTRAKSSPRSATPAGCLPQPTSSAAALRPA